jgi:hypothetical protein
VKIILPAALLLTLILISAQASQATSSNPVCTISTGTTPPSEGKPLDTRGFPSILGYRLVVSSKDKKISMDCDLIQIPEKEVISKDSKTNSEYTTDYFYKGKKLASPAPIGTKQLTRLEILWGNKWYRFPNAAIAGFCIPVKREFKEDPEPSLQINTPVKPTNDFLDLIGSFNDLVSQKLPSGDTLYLRIIPSLSQETLLTQTEEHSCCCNGSYVTWILDQKGNFLRHLHSYDETVLSDLEEQISNSSDPAELRPTPIKGKKDLFLLKANSIHKAAYLNVTLVKPETAKNRQIPKNIRNFFNPGDFLIRQFDIVWDKKPYKVPKQFWDDLVLPQALGKNPNTGNWENMVDITVSDDGTSLMVSWPIDGEKGCNVTWLIGRDGSVMRTITKVPPEKPDSFAPKKN